MKATHNRILDATNNRLTTKEHHDAISCRQHYHHIDVYSDIYNDGLCFQNSHDKQTIVMINAKWFGAIGHMFCKLI